MQFHHGTEDRVELKNILKQEIRKHPNPISKRASAVIADLMWKLNLRHKNNPNTQIKFDAAMSTVLNPTNFPTLQ